MLDMEMVERLELYIKVRRHRRPNTPIIEGQIIDHVPVHLTIDDLELLVSLARHRIESRPAELANEAAKQAALG